MAYTRLNMVAGDVFKASDMRHIEDALELALSNANSGNAKIFPVAFTDNENKIVADKTFSEIYVAIEKGYVIQGSLPRIIDGAQVIYNFNVFAYSNEAIGFVASLGIGAIMLRVFNNNEILIQELASLTEDDFGTLTIKYSNNSTSLYGPNQGDTTITVPSIDTTLKKTNYAADAKIVGDKITTLNTKVDNQVELINDSLDEVSQEVNLIKINEISNLQNQIDINSNAIKVLTEGTDPNTIDGVKDLIDYVNDHGSTTQQMQSDIEALKNKPNIYEISSDSVDINEVITHLPSGAIISKGDIILVTNTLGVKSAYQYDEEWIACDGNVDASKVIMPFDITLAGSYTQVGNLTKTATGRATFATKGKSVAVALQEILSKREQPEITSRPKVTFNSVTTGAYEVGTTITPSWNVSLSPGSYTYGPPTGITATQWSIKDTNGESSVAASGSFTDLVVTDELNYSITAEAKHEQGATAYDNLGDASDPSLMILKNTVSTTSAPITGYRSWFMYIGTNNTSTVSSSFIRSNANNMGDGNAAVTQNNVIIPAGTKRIIIALPQKYNKTLTSIIDVDGMGLDVIGNFTKSTMSIEGNKGYQSITYNIWAAENPNGLAATKYNFIIN